MSLTNAARPCRFGRLSLISLARNFRARFLSSALLLCVSLAAMNSLHAAGINTWASGVSGNWDTAANWSQNPNIPGTAGQTDDDVVLPGSGGQTLTLNNTILANLGIANMTVRSFVGNNSTSFPFTVNISGTSSTPLVFNVGEVGNDPAYGLRTLRSNVWHLDWVDLNVVGSPTTQGWEIERMRSNTQTEHAVLTNTNVNILSPLANTGLYVHADNDNGGYLNMTGGSLTVTNNTNNAKINLGGGNGLNGNDISVLGKIGAKITLNDTPLNTNIFEVHNNATFRFNNGGLVGTSTIGTLLIGRAGHADFVSGNLQIGTITFGPDSSRDYFLGFHPDIDVTGANVTATTINMTTSAPEPGASYKININSGGILSATTVNVAGTSTNRGDYQINVGDDGVFNPTTLNLGNANNQGQHGAGLLNMSGGSLNATNVKLGNTAHQQFASDGYWNQTGGVATISNTFQFNRGREAFNSSNVALGFNSGSREFRVTENATMTLTGLGFTMDTSGTLVGGGTDWLMNAVDWDVSGTIKFSPGVGVTNQTFIAFGEDVGAPMFTDFGLVDPFFQGNFSVGTLDLSDLDGDEVLMIVPAGNYATNALYVDELLGLTPDTVALHLDSTLNLYYNALNSPDLEGLTYALTSGGFLIAVSAVPEPNTLMLLGLGLLVLPRRRKQG